MNSIYLFWKDTIQPITQPLAQTCLKDLRDIEAGKRGRGRGRKIENECV
jgi:hypothetical protein